ncbi:MAG: hypothetical protein HY956_03155 [Deltaproteobacteria bacterium]|nr:hypothetical protein [Deltaproteobacteria bacterium]
MRKADRAYLEKNEAQLRKAFSWSKIGKERDSTDCFFLGREMFSNQLYADSFYLHDVDADGRLDVIYAGHAYCAEGNSTLIWFGDRDGFVIKEQHVFDNILALRIKEGTPVQLSSVEEGCCADEIDRYHLGTIDAPRKQNISV